MARTKLRDAGEGGTRLDPEDGPTVGVVVTSKIIDPETATATMTESAVVTITP